MTNHIVPRDGDTVRPLALGLLLGVLLGLATSFVFLLVILAPLFGMVMTATGLRSVPMDRSRTAAGAGLLIGVGGLYLYGALNTLISCYGSEVCGGVSTLPLLAWALLVAAPGVVIAATLLRRS